METKPVITILNNSPIEFVLTVPRRGRDEIEVRSEGAKLDLIGFTMDDHEERPDYHPFDLMRMLPVGSPRQLNIVKSFKAEDLEPEVDSRSSAFKFAWVGFSSNLSRSRIERMFNRSLPELREALTSRNPHQIEVAIAPVIYWCSKAHAKRVRFQRALLVTLIMYALIGFFVWLFAVHLNSPK